MIIIGIILSIVAIIGGIYLIYDGIVNIENRDNISSGILFILLNVVLLFIYLKNLGWI
jgi:hypothetical protein